MRKKINYILITAVMIGGVLAGWKIFIEKEEGSLPTLAELRFINSGENSEDNSIKIELGANSVSYTNTKYGFSFQHPIVFTVGEFENAGSDVVLIQNDSGVGMQIFITTIAEDIPITEEEIKSDIPGIEVRNPQQVRLSGGQIGLAFLSNNEEFGGNSREIWFVHKKRLYQMSTYANMEELVEEIIHSFVFK